MSVKSSPILQRSGTPPPSPMYEWERIY
jgi:hypothetical protein